MQHDRSGGSKKSTRMENRTIRADDETWELARRMAKMSGRDIAGYIRFLIWQDAQRVERGNAGDSGAA